MLRAHLFVCAVMAIFASACGGTSRIDRTMKPLPNEVVLTIDNQGNLFGVEVRIADRNCSRGSEGKPLFVRGGEKRLFRLRAVNFGFTRFTFQVRLRTPAGLNVVKSGCSGDSRPPPPGSIVKFNIPGNLTYLPAVVPLIKER